MFSAEAITPITFIFKFNSLIVFIVPNTLAAPHISYFISSIPLLGLIDIPPVSNVIPFPTRAIGFSLLLAPLYFIVISFEGSSLPFPTESKQFIPIDFISFSL